jgi:tetratricopeptide (TPR) repeat protein
MKSLGAFLVVLLGAGTLTAQDAGLKTARQRLLRGDYAEARGMFTALAKEARFRAAAAIGLSRVWQSEGEYEKALDAVESALKDVPGSADLLARQAEILFLRGRLDEAEKIAGKALTHDADHFLAHWILGQAYRDRGELEKADDEFRWFVRTYSSRSNNDMDIKDPEALVLVGLAGTERARWHSLTDQFRFILKEVYGEAIQQDKDYWWAEYYSGRLLQEKYNKRGAFQAYERALAINPQAAEVYAAKGEASLQSLEIKDAALYAEEALRINPRLLEALRLQADLNLFEGDAVAALKVLAKAQEVNPRDEATLARVAVCLRLQKKTDAFAELLRRVDKLDAKAGVFYYELADRLEERKFYDEAEKYFRIAHQRNPKLPWAQNGLGLLYMRLGREDEARKTLEQAFDADRFNVRVSNTLRVLDELDKYDAIKTEHFLVRFDPKHDVVLARFLARRLEKIYAELAAKFSYRPRGPILIEVFKTHEMFSGRVVALPDLHTIGACTGSMFAMVSPRDKSRVITKPFNWVRVIRHEMVHIFNLEQTKFQVPHWLTEGLAVANEGFPPPPEWQFLLARRVASEELMNLDNILMGFARPGSSEDWTLAYLQSLLYVQYLEKNFGPSAVGALLAAYAGGLDTDAAIQKVCKIGKAEFEKGYRAFLQERVRDSGVAKPARVLSFKQLKEEHAKDPNNTEIAAQLAERYLQVGDRTKARQLAEAVLVAKKNHPLAAYVRAMLLFQGGDADQAMSVLDAAVDPKKPNAKVLRLLAKLQLDAKKLAGAAKTCELGRSAEPYEKNWLVQLARIYDEKKDDARLIEVLKALAPMDPDDLPTRRKLAGHLLKAGKYAEAEQFARQAMEIDVLDREAQDTLASALAAQKKENELRQFKELVASP